MHKIDFWRGIICLVLVLTLKSPATALPGKAVRMLVYNYQPFYLQTDDGHWTGIHIDLAEALCRKAGFDIEFLHLPWNRAMGYIETGNLDMIVGLSITPERETFIEFIGVCNNEQFGFVMHKKDVDTSLNSLDDLAAMGGTWGIRDRMHYSDAFNARLGSDPFQGTVRSTFLVGRQFR